MDKWIMGAFAVLLGLGGLILSSRAADSFMYGFGLALATAAFVFVLYLIAIGEKENGH